jgi:hypothetical protein
VTHRLLSFILLIAFVCQSLPVLSAQAVGERSQQIEHVMLHGQDTDHHHHDDQSLHVEDSAQSAQHQHADTGISTACLPTVGWGAIFRLLPVSPDASVQAPGATPFLDGPLRPPQSVA